MVPLTAEHRPAADATAHIGARRLSNVQVPTAAPTQAATPGFMLALALVSGPLGPLRISPAPPSKPRRHQQVCIIT